MQEEFFREASGSSSMKSTSYVSSFTAIGSKLEEEKKDAELDAAVGVQSTPVHNVMNEQQMLAALTSESPENDTRLIASSDNIMPPTNTKKQVSILKANNQMKEK